MWREEDVDEDEEERRMRRKIAAAVQPREADDAAEFSSAKSHFGKTFNLLFPQIYIYLCYIPNSTRRGGIAYSCGYLCHQHSAVIECDTREIYIRDNGDMYQIQGRDISDTMGI